MNSIMYIRASDMGMYTMKFIAPIYICMTVISTIVPLTAPRVNAPDKNPIYMKQIERFRLRMALFAG